jgi:membrane protein
MISTAEMKDRAARAVWDVDLRGLPRWRTVLTRAARMVYAVARDLTTGQLTLQAMSLVYTTLLSLVPLLAVSFSVLKGFGVHNQMEPMLLNLLQPLGQKGVEITERVIGFVENVRVGVLGSLGLALLMFTVVSLIQKVERAFNHTWRVKTLRPLTQRFSDYLSVILIGPVLVFSALGATASITGTPLVQELAAIEPFGTLIETLAKLVPYVLIIAAFTFVYMFVPNTRVRLGSALLGAAVAGVLWQTVGWGFAFFVVSSTKYQAIYSSFAILILFMIWLYLAWLILLVGASIAFYHQHPEYLLSRRQDMKMSNRLKERVALLAMHYIGQRHYRGEPPWTLDALARCIGVPTEVVETVLLALEERRILLRTDGEEIAYVPARALETLRVRDLLQAIRSAEEDAYLNLDRLPADPAVEGLLREVQGAVDAALEGRTLRELVLGARASPAAGALPQESGPRPEEDDSEADRANGPQAPRATPGA